MDPLVALEQSNKDAIQFNNDILKQLSILETAIKEQKKPSTQQLKSRVLEIMNAEEKSNESLDTLQKSISSKYSQPLPSAFPRPSMEDASTLEARASNPTSIFLPCHKNPKFQTPSTHTWINRTDLVSLNQSIAYSMQWKSNIDPAFTKAYPLFLSESKTHVDPSRTDIVNIFQSLQTILSTADGIEVIKTWTENSLALFDSVFLRGKAIYLAIELYSLFFFSKSQINLMGKFDIIHFVNTLKSLHKTYYYSVPQIQTLFPKWLHFGLVLINNKDFKSLDSLFIDSMKNLITHIALPQPPKKWVLETLSKSSNLPLESISTVFFQIICHLLHNPSSDSTSLIINLGRYVLPNLAKYSRVMILSQKMSSSLSGANQNPLDAWDPHVFIQCGLDSVNILKLYSHFICPVSQGANQDSSIDNQAVLRAGLPGDCSAPGDPEIPYMLPCGHILSGRTLIQLVRRKSLKCAYCPWFGRISRAKRLQF